VRSLSHPVSTPIVTPLLQDDEEMVALPVLFSGRRIIICFAFAKQRLDPQKGESIVYQKP
jgi:hypothetical protein